MSGGAGRGSDIFQAMVEYLGKNALPSSEEDGLIGIPLLVPTLEHKTLTQPALLASQPAYGEGWDCTRGKWTNTKWKMECHVLPCHETKPALDPKHIWRPKRGRVNRWLSHFLSLHRNGNFYYGWSILCMGVLLPPPFPARKLAHKRSDVLSHPHGSWVVLTVMFFLKCCHTFPARTKLYLTVLLYTPTEDHWAEL